MCQMAACQLPTNDITFVALCRSRMTTSRSLCSAVHPQLTSCSSCTATHPRQHHDCHAPITTVLLESFHAGRASRSGLHREQPEPHSNATTAVCITKTSTHISQGSCKQQQEGMTFSSFCCCWTTTLLCSMPWEAFTPCCRVCSHSDVGQAI